MPKTEIDITFLHELQSKAKARPEASIEDLLTHPMISPRELRSLMGNVIRVIKRGGRLLHQTFDCSVYEIASVRYIVYHPMPLAAETVAVLDPAYGVDPHEASELFLLNQAIELGMAAAPAAAL